MKNLLFLLPLLFSTALIAQQPGSLDLSFGANGIVQYPTGTADISTAWGADVAPDGKLVFGGLTNGQPYIVRLKPDGSRDTEFGQNGIAMYPYAVFDKIVALPGGKILLLGGPSVVRLNADGSVDSGFECQAPPSHQIYDCALQPDGKFIVAISGWQSPTYQFCIARFLENGQLDTDFAQNGYAFIDGPISGYAFDIALQPDGKIVAAGEVVIDGLGDQFRLMRYLPNGAPDPSFGDNGMVVSVNDSLDYYGLRMLLQPDGKILIASQWQIPDPQNWPEFSFHAGLLRFLPNGELDFSFGNNGIQETAFIYTYAIFLQENGQIQVIAQDYNEAGYLYQFLPDGAVDEAFEKKLLFNKYTATYTKDFAQQPDGKIVMAYSQVWEPSPMSSPHPPSFEAARLLVNGEFEGDFNGIGFVFAAPPYENDALLDFRIQPNGKILVMGQSPSLVFDYNIYTTVQIPFVSRLSADGAGEQWGFSPSAVFPYPVSWNPAQTPIPLYKVAPQPDGKVLLAYRFEGFRLARFKAEKAVLDSTFGINGIARVDALINPVFQDITLQADGKILLGILEYPSNTFAVARFLSNGSIDASFGIAGKKVCGNFNSNVKIEALTDGKIVLYSLGGEVLRLLPDGQRDPDFGTDGKTSVPHSIGALKGLPDGKMLIFGAFGAARILVDGAGLDLGFGTEKGVLPLGFSSFEDALIQSNGKISVLGRSGNQTMLVQITPNGQIDSTLNGNGITLIGPDANLDNLLKMAIQPNGKIIAGVNQASITGTRITLLRYLSGFQVGANAPVVPQTANMAQPNPFSESLYLDFSALPASVETLTIGDLNGRVVFAQTGLLTNNLAIQSAGNWPLGIYIVRANAGRSVFVQKILKARN